MFQEFIFWDFVGQFQGLWPKRAFLFLQEINCWTTKTTICYIVHQNWPKKLTMTFWTKVGNLDLCANKEKIILNKFKV